MQVATGEVVADALQRLWPEHGPQLLLSSFEREAVARPHDTWHRTSPRGLLAGALPRDWAVAMEGLACTTLHLDQRPSHSRTMRTLTAAGVPVLLYTVNEAARARELLSAGASGGVHRSAGCAAREPRRSVATHQPDQPALDLDLMRAEDPDLEGGIGGLERDRGAAPAQPLQRNLAVLDHRHDDGAVLGVVAALDDRIVAVMDAGFDHRGAHDLQHVVLALAEQHARHFDHGGGVGQGLDR